MGRRSVCVCVCMFMYVWEVFTVHVCGKKKCVRVCVRVCVIEKERKRVCVRVNVLFNQYDRRCCVSVCKGFSVNTRFILSEYLPA